MNALAWKSEQLGISYGKLVQQLSSHDLYLIYKEYEALQVSKKKSDSEKEKHAPC